MKKIKQLALQVMKAESTANTYAPLHELIDKLCKLTDFNPYPELFLDTDATYTAQGKAVSPVVAARCAEDIERSRVFMRGVFEAIADRAAEGKKVEFLYAGTGPFALLILPALAHFNASQLQVTLLDIHRSSLDCLHKIIDHLDASPLIATIECTDATTWSPPSPKRFDIVLSETMKHLLQQEPQVSVFSQLQQFLAADGILIPEEISLQAWLNDRHPSLICTSKTRSSEHLLLGEFFKLNLDTARRIHNDESSLFTARLQVPPEAQAFPHLKLTTDIRVYKQHLLTENQSQLTLPRYMDNACMTPRTWLTCTYRQGQEPDWDFDYESASDIDFARIDIVVPLQAIQAELATLLAQSWTAHVNQRDYNGGWDVLPLRCQREHIHAHPVLQSFSVEHGDDWEYLPLIQSCPAMLNFLNTLQCSLKSVRLMRLKAGAEIKAHRDSGLGLAYGEVRLHLPLHTSKDVEFFCNQHRVPMQAGELWYFNADKLHAVRNRSGEDRINLVIDCRANNWLRDNILAGFQEKAA